MVFNKYTKENRLFSGKVKIMFNSRFSLCEELPEQTVQLHIFFYYILSMFYLFFLFLFLCFCIKDLKAKPKAGRDEETGSGL